MARPRQAIVKDAHIAFRVSPLELHTVREAARRAGLSASDFARGRVLGSAKRRAGPAHPGLALDPDLWLQVRKLGVNLNQIAHRLNAAQAPSVPPDLDPLLAEIRQLLAQNIPAKIHGRKGRT